MAIFYKLLFITSLINIKVFYCRIIRRRIYNNIISGLLNNKAYRKANVFKKTAVKAV